MAKSNNDTRKMGKESDARKEKLSKPTVNAAGSATKQDKLRNSKTHYNSPYAF